MLYLRIYGDNIVECERTWSLLKKALSDQNSISKGPYGLVVSPKYELNFNNKEDIQVQFFPGFGRWTPNILDFVRSKGGLLREAVDSIITVITKNEGDEDYESSLVSIEFCGALPAGNQAWQRTGRGYSFASSGIPYIYIAEIGGFELDKRRQEKAMRFPNPVVPFSFLTFSFQSSVPTLPIFLSNPAIMPETYELFKDCFGERELNDLICAFIYQQEISDIVDRIVTKTLKFVNILSKVRRKKDTFIEPIWAEWIDWIKKGNRTSDFISKMKLPWEKIAYIKDLTPTAKSVIQNASKYAFGIGASQVPICLIPKSTKSDFVAMIKSQYQDLTDDFKNWLSKEKELGICWILGFKPRGDDARPDRGLPPLARMLLGSDIDLMSFIYGPAKKFTWPLLRDNPKQLAEQNGLWEAIMTVSDAIIVDSNTDHRVTKKGYLRDHWGNGSSIPQSIKLSLIEEWPSIKGENDVDTILHLLLKSDDNSIFEGMCNPPGGDWSGMSILDTTDGLLELRWLSLPRVSASGSKRPDHVYQFRTEEKKVILSIESKELAKRVESRIGPRLTQYVKELISSTASVEREYPYGNWKRSSKAIDLSKYKFASAVAFLINRYEEILNVCDDANTDLIIGIKLRDSDKSAEIVLGTNSSLGKDLSQIIIGSATKKNLDFSIEVF